jgi:hypothetical protein
MSTSPRHVERPDKGNSNTYLTSLPSLPLPLSVFPFQGDWGQCEFDFGAPDAQGVKDRPWNDAIPREDHYTRKWGHYPREYTGTVIAREIEIGIYVERQIDMCYI